MLLAPAIAAWVDESLQKEGRLPGGKKTSLAPLSGNPERKDHSTLQRHVVSVEGHPLALLTVGVQLAALRDRTTLFAQAYPALACPVFAFGTIEGQDVLLAEYFNGCTSQQALAEPAIGEKGVLGALEKLASLFNASLQPSTTEAARAELQELFARVLAIEQWTAFDRGFLTSIVFPFVEEKLLATPPRRRVSNGDLTLGNLLVDAAGNIKLIDYEQAAITHFHQEDWLRLTFWHAPTAVRDLAMNQMVDPVAARLVFYLKQIVFENAVIQSAKARADIAHWAKELGSLIFKTLPQANQSLLWPDRISSESSDNKNISAQQQSRTMELFHYARHMAGCVGRSETKINQMQQSFSWRCTAWLRALRRKFLDPKRRPAARPMPPPAFPFVIEDFVNTKAAQLHYHLDTSEDEIIAGAKVCFQGWVFSTSSAKIVKVRAKIGARLHEGEYGLERTEIAEKFLPQAYSRFRIESVIEAGDGRADLEAMNEDGEWLLFFSKLLRPSSASGLSWACSAEAIRSRYEHWVRMYDTPPQQELSSLAEKSLRLPHRPLISLVMPVHNPSERWLDQVISSVRAQTYPNWELCIADDASVLPHVKPLLERHAKEDRRIKVLFRTTNGHISAASNTALEVATGEFVAFIDHDDELAPHALYYCAELLSLHQDAELVYSDEDKIDEDGKRFDPHFKPDWNPDLLRGQNYLSHLTVYRTQTVRSFGGLREGYDGSQDWDLGLRITEKIEPSKIHHIPRVLYHWRAIEGSTAAHLKSKSYASEASRKVLTDHMTRAGLHPKLESVKGSHWRIHYPIPTPAPLVTLIIPTRNRRELLAACIQSIRNKTTYPNFEFLIADNESDDPELLAFYEKQKEIGNFSVLPCRGPFNYSVINNRSVKASRGALIGLLNNDLEALNPEWLSEMVSHALRQEIGVVGAKLYYPDMRVQHAGVITGLGGVAGHAFKNFPRNDPGTPQFRPHLVQNISAVTAACAVMRKSVFVQAGGFDEENLKVAFNDVDFCLRVQALGYRNLFTPFAELIHHESASRGAEDSPEKLARFAKEIDFMKKRWGARLLNDAAYNPNLTLDTEDFAYAFPPRNLS